MIQSSKTYLRDLKFLNLAFEEAKKSPDNRKQVGCIITYPDGEEIISKGFNSKPLGVTDYDKCVDPLTGKSDVTLIHAEEQALLTDRSIVHHKVLYCTSCPCMRCASRIIHNGSIRRVVFTEDHDNNISVEYLRSNGIIVDKVLMNGTSRTTKKVNR